MAWRELAIMAALVLHSRVAAASSTITRSVWNTSRRAVADVLAPIFDVDRRNVSWEAITGPGAV